MTNGTPDQNGRDLLLRHLEALRSDLIREFLSTNEIAPLGQTKGETLARAVSALEGGEVPWDRLVAYLDTVEPYGKQHVVLYDTEAPLDDWTEEAVSDLVEESGLADIRDNPQPLAAPDEMQLSSISLGANFLEVYAIARRVLRQRRLDLDNTLAPDPSIEAVVYELVPIRSWVRLQVNLSHGRASIHMSQLDRKADYRALLDDFTGLVSSWFPVDALRPIDLAKAVKSLHEAWESGEKDASPQKLQYESPDGIHSSLSSSTRQQAVLGQTTELDEAAERMKQSGVGSGANLYFLSTADGSQVPNNPIDDPVHVEVIVRDERVNFRRPVRPEDLDYVIRRIRVHAS